MRCGCFIAVGVPLPVVTSTISWTMSLMTVILGAHEASAEIYTTEAKSFMPVDA